MTGQRETTRYATASLTFDDRGFWIVRAHPDPRIVGFVDRDRAGWVANTFSGRYAGLWPTKQAAAEVLVKQAGYELELT